MKTKQIIFLKYKFIILILFSLFLPISSQANQSGGNQFANSLIKKNSNSNNKKDDKYYLEAGIQKYSKSKSIEAIQDFYKAIEKNPQNYDAYFWRGSVLRDLACTDIKKAADLGQVTAIKELKRICSYMISGKDKLKDYMDDGFKKMINGDLKGSLESYTSAIALNADYARAYQFRGSVYFEMGKDNLALKDLNKSIQLAPKNSSALLFRGLIKYGSNDIKGACKDYKASYNLGNNEAVKEFNEKCSNINF